MGWSGAARSLFHPGTDAPSTIKRLARIFRLFKLGKHSEQFALVIDATRRSTEGITLLFFMMTLGIIFFSSIVYFAELSECYQDDDSKVWYYKSDDSEVPFQSIIHTFWWTVVTMCTVGYGDQVPRTTAGKIVASMCMICGILVLAFPITLLSASFAQVYETTKEQKKRRKLQRLHDISRRIIRKQSRMSVLHLCRLYSEVARDVSDAIGETRDSCLREVRMLEYYDHAIEELQHVMQVWYITLGR